MIYPTHFNCAEAERVRTVFDLYLKRGSMLPVVLELKRRGWTNKVWTTRAGKQVGGRTFDRPTLHALITNPIFAGKTVHKDERYEGEHEAIVSDATFAAVQRRLAENARRKGAGPCMDGDVLLRGVLRCKTCDCAMVHTLTGRGTRKHRYYVCSKANRTSRSGCPAKSLPAAEVESAVVEQLRDLTHDRSLLRETVREARVATDTALETLAAERETLESKNTRRHAELRRIATEAPATTENSGRIAALHDEIRVADERLIAIADEARHIESDVVTESDVEGAFADFDGLWEAMTPREQRRITLLLVERAEFDGADSSLEITFRDAGIRSLAAARMEDAA